MEKQRILNEIRRTARENGGKPLGVRRFLTQTGVKESDWHGKYWVPWGDALVEAGFAPNQWQEAYDEGVLIGKLISLTRELGKFPVKGDLLHEGFQDVLELCPDVADRTRHSHEKGADAEEIGFVYLIKSGRYYKIGRSNSSGRREYELAIQLPEKVTKVHEIRTDDPVGIEAYWHNRFASKRKNGEWFDLARPDINAFRPQIHVDAGHDAVAF